MDADHETRRQHAPAEAPLDLQAAATELLQEASEHSAGRAARTLTPGGGAPLKQTLMALKAGQRLQDHVAPGPTTLTGIVGRVVLRHGDGDVMLSAGHWAPCPREQHSLEAETDSVLMITVTPETRADQATR